MSSYRKQKIQEILSKPQKTDKNVKNSIIETVKQIVVGVLGGGAAGAAIGKPAFGIGAILSGVGHFTGQALLSMFGFGMMASNSYSKQEESEDQPVMEKAKARVKSFGETFKQKLYLDKLPIGSKKESNSDNQQSSDDTNSSSDPKQVSNSLSGADPNIVIDNLENDLIQAAESYAQTDISDSLELENDSMIDSEFEELDDDLETDLNI